jgi:hypothetical protein
MISLRHRVNEALCGRNGRRRRVRCHVAAFVTHPCRIPQRVASSPAVSGPVSRPSRIRHRVRVVSGTASVSHQRHRVRAASRRATSVSRQRHRVRAAPVSPCRIRVAARHTASVSQPAAPRRSPPRRVAARRVCSRRRRCGAHCQRAIRNAAAPDAIHSTQPGRRPTRGVVAAAGVSDHQHARRVARAPASPRALRAASDPPPHRAHGT